MTAMPEAKLAREAELPYAIVAMVTDYDCWHPDHDHVTVEQVIKILNGNAERARALLKARGAEVGTEARKPSPLNIEHTLDTALITAPEKRDPILVCETRRGRGPRSQESLITHGYQVRHSHNSRLS